jgi:thiol-disulfide isomerase/thioredoxin
MNTIIVLVIVAFTALILYRQWSVLAQAKRCQGKPAPDTSTVDGGINADKRVYFFHAAHCGPCKAITPLVDRVRQEFPNLIKVDVAANLELAQAFGIAATPSFIVVCDGVVSEVKLGGVSASWLRERLAP